LREQPLPRLQEKVIEDKLYRRAYRLALFTIVYNIAEGILSTYFGASDSSLTLFGFGVDSFIEALSGLGIAHMVLRIRRDPAGARDGFEKTALQVTGISFYVLAAGLSVTILLNILGGHKPETTLPGVIISLVSIAVMLLLIRSKMRVGRALHSPAIIADAACAKVCVYMSVALLVSSLAYEITGFGQLDSIGAAAIAYLSYGEGWECFRKARSGDACVCVDD
jgi:divalent metal cation (Fe/Co/Zn/Cd) transporter